MQDKALFSSIESTIIFRNGICSYGVNLLLLWQDTSLNYINISGPGTRICNKLIQDIL